MVVDLIPTPVPSSKDKMLGKTLPASTDEVELNFQEYGHVRDLCPSNGPEKGRGESKEGSTAVAPEKEKSVEPSESFRPWMLVERKSRRNQGSNASLVAKFQGKNGEGSRFNALSLLTDTGSGSNNLPLGKQTFQDANPVSERAGQIHHASTQEEHIQVQSTIVAKYVNSEYFPVFPLQVRLHREWNKIFRPWNLMELKRILIQLSKLPWGVGVQLTDGILDPDKHSAVIFKENLHSKSREHAVGRKFEALEAGSLRNIERKNSSKVGFGWGG
ncbi:hypothetical protein Goari_023728 [Gossypium aridum]|uniref:Uncharacterized protein n=1 Tax=Gossypium aridum TaxID=34290 RepID=A0A7J8X432_GOSAI|nr:hypothetical protein [Gossypium aridum]